MEKTFAFKEKVVSTLQNMQLCILSNRFLTQEAIIIRIPNSDFEGSTMNLMWQLKVNDPRQSINWKVLREFSEDQFEVYQELIKELNQINAPVQLRIERKPD